MGAKVVDASAVAAMLFTEPGFEAVTDLLEGFERHAPNFVELELASVFLKKLRAEPEQAVYLKSRLSLWPQVGLRLFHVPVQSALDLAVKEDISVYDAQYLWLAKDKGVELITLDARLSKAALKKS